MYAALPSLEAVGMAAARAVMLVVEVVADVDVVAEVAAEAQVKADPQTNLRLTKSPGFKPTSTTSQRSTLLRNAPSALLRSQSPFIEIYLNLTSTSTGESTPPVYHGLISCQSVLLYLLSAFEL